MSNSPFSTGGSLAGKILRVDLGDEDISVGNTDKYAERWLGGRAINSWILLDELTPETEWSDAENILAFGVGSLVGTLTPGACRVSVDTKNVFNGGKGSANFGGHFGSELKFAGFDHITLEGKSDNPVYLWINDSEVEIRDASEIWGKTTSETEEMLRDRLDEKVRVASIGPAGENLVKGSGIVADSCKVAGGSGVGCVMGDKKVKAIAVRGTESVKVSDPAEFIEASSRTFEKVRSSASAQKMRESTLLYKYSPENDDIWNGLHSVRNAQDLGWPKERRNKLVGEEEGVPSYRRKITACAACPVGCMPYWKIDEGEYEGVKGSGYWINSAIYSGKFDVDDPEASLRYHQLANDLGLDGDDSSVVLAWAFECFEKGLISKEDTGGLELNWGDEEAMLEMQKKLAYREDLGDLLGEGVKTASEKLGKGSEEFAVHQKGQGTLDAYRVLKGWALGCATSPVAGRHLRGAVSPPSGPIDGSPGEYERQAERVFWQLRNKEIEDMLGLCVYVGTWSGAYALYPEDYVDLINAAMGTKFSKDELFLQGLRSYNLEKAFNTIHAGFDRSDNFPHRRFLKEPVETGPFKGEKVNEKKYGKMLDEFYELLNWDKDTGLQTRACLEELNMPNVAEKLSKAGKLVE